MRLSLRRRPVEPALPGISAVARVDASTRRLASRVRPGEIAVIDHVDLDRGAAEALVAARPAAVLNVKPSMSGRFPALGAGVLVNAGIPLLDECGTELLTHVSDGEPVRLDGDVLHVGEHTVASGVLQTPQSVERATAAARRGLDVQLEAFTAAASEILRREHALLLDGSGAPPLTTPIAGRPVVVVAEGPAGGDHLTALKGFLKDRKPVLIGVETGADVIRAAGLRPDIVVGDFDRVSDATLQSGAELVLHSRHTTRPAGELRAQRLVVATTPFPYAGRSEDAALLLADAAEASVIVLAGSSEGLVAALDAGRTAMASTFLTRLEVSGRLVSAASVTALHRRGAPRRMIAALLACQLVAFGAAVAAAGGPAEAWDKVTDRIESSVSSTSQSVTGAVDSAFGSGG